MKRKSALLFSVLVGVFIIIGTGLAFHQSVQKKYKSLEPKVDQLFSEWDKPDSPGCALAIIKDGTIIYKKGYGIADLEHDVPITAETVFYIGSTSKQFVAMCILLLEEQGKLSLDDDIRKYLPEFPEYDIPITIRQLIHHTSGIRDYLSLWYLSGKNYLDHMPEDGVYEMICRQKDLNFSPGERHMYSNSCYFLLALIVKKASGQSLKEFAQKNIFNVLGMKNSHFQDDNTYIIKNRAFSYSINERGEFTNLIMRFALVGSGGLYTTVEDLFLWDQNFYHNKLGKSGQKLIEKMHENGKLNNGQEINYAFALVNGTYRGLKTVQHDGALAGYRAKLIRFPGQKFSIVLLSNLGTFNPNPLAYKIADLYLAGSFKTVKAKAKKEKAPMKRKIISLKPTSYNKYIGRYKFEEGFIATISKKNNKLMAQTTGPRKVEIFPESETKFFLEAADMKFSFQKEIDGHFHQLTFHNRGQDSIGKRIESVPLTEEQLKEYAGDYYSDELQTVYKIYCKDRKPFVKIPNYPEVELKITGKDVFEGRFIMSFQRSELFDCL
jgi:CubicO group peptidase (beta-lactamase class C family)